MADINAKVVAMVERVLKSNPELRSAELRERALKIDKTVGKLTGRQFHARYALQARRKLFGAKKRAKSPAKGQARGAAKGAAKRPAKRPAKKQTPRARSSAPQTVSDPVVALLTTSYEEKRAALDDAIDSAFQRALEADSVKRVNSLLSSIDRETRNFESA